MKISSLLGLVLLSFPGLSLAAGSGDPSSIHDQIQGMLDQRHPKDSPQWWRGLGPEAPPVIISMYEQSTRINERVKLVAALGFYDDPRALDFLKSQAQDSSPDVIRQSAIRAIGIEKGVAEADFVAKFLSHSDADTRLAAAEALQNMHDPRAQALVDRYLVDEKATWIVARLKGKAVAPPPGTQLVAVSTEDRVSADFVGTWRGYWVRPRAGTASGMLSEPVIVRWKTAASPRELEGELVLGGKDAAKKGALRWSVSKVSGRGKSISGMLVESSGTSVAPGPVASAGPGAAPAAASTESEFRGELTREDGSLVLVMRVPARGGTLVLRRDPAI